jgi:CRISPR-associated protein Cas8a1/Csx13
MTLLHRAGLGGLAATLKAIERHRRLGRLSNEDTPGSPTSSAALPWRVEPDLIALDWGEPAEAREYLRKLFAFAFRIKDKLIDLPGTYRDELNWAVRAELQHGLTLTFLQHGKVRSLGDPSVRFIDPTGDGTAQIGIDWRPCSGFKHQRQADELTNSRGMLAPDALEIDGPLYPGAAERHSEAKFKKATKLAEHAERALALCFAPIGCLSLRLSRSVGVLLVPSVMDLVEFAHHRPRMTPTSSRDCRIASPGDAALQLIVRLKAARMLSREPLGIGSIYAVRLRPQAWDKKQKYRDATLSVVPMGSHRAEESRLRQFQLAMSHLPPRISTLEQVREHYVGRGKDAKGKQKLSKLKTTERVWYDSAVRPLVADNLACGRRWYDDFPRLMLNRDKAKRVNFERKGLQDMVDERELLDDRETNFIHALHRAIFLARGKIYQDGMDAEARERGDKATPKVVNRWNRFTERLRLDLLGAKTKSQTQAVITALLARTGTVTELHDERALRDVKNLIFGNDWQRAKNLGMLALASYKRPTGKPSLPGDPEDQTDAAESELQSTGMEIEPEENNE